MIMHPVRYQMFDLEFEDFERNRMYPPGYRKESPMIRLSMAHVDAVVHAEFYLHRAKSKLFDPDHINEAEDDLLRLAELKLFAIQHMHNEHQLLPAEPHGHKS